MQNCRYLSERPHWMMSRHPQGPIETVASGCSSLFETMPSRLLWRSTFENCYRFFGRCAGERGVNHRQMMPPGHVVDVCNAQDAAQFVRGDKQRAWRFGRPRNGLRECSGHSCVETDVSFHLLHDLMNMPVQHGYRTEAFQICESLCAVLRSPAPFRVDRPERNVGEHNDRRAC